MALPADLFLQAWRPSAYVISGTVNWLGLFIIGMSFPYIVVRISLTLNIWLIVRCDSYICFMFIFLHLLTKH